MCDAQRDELGGAESASGVNHTDAKDLATETDGNVKFKVCLGGDINSFQVGMELDADQSTAKTVVHNHISDIASGCPFCGSTNWRGDY